MYPDSIDDTSILSMTAINNNLALRMDTGKVGSTRINYFFTDNYTYISSTDDGNPDACTVQPGGSSSGGDTTVQPTVTISGGRLVLASGTGGASSSTNVQLTATGTPTGGTYAWSTSGSVSLANSSTQTVTVSGASGGISNVTVTYSLNGVSAKAIQAETVQQPATLPVASDTENNAASGCPAGYAGWTRAVMRQLQDQGGAPIFAAGLTINETFTVAANGLGITASSVHTGTGITNVYGQESDRFSFCSTACPASSSSAALSQHLTQGTYTLATSTLKYSCKSIIVQYRDRFEAGS